jgi:glutamine synthetase
MTPKELMKFVKDKGIKIIDFRFVDLPGLWQHFSMTSGELVEDMFEEGVGFDGSSIRGFQKIRKATCFSSRTPPRHLLIRSRLFPLWTSFAT